MKNAGSSRYSSSTSTSVGGLIATCRSLPMPWALQRWHADLVTPREAHDGGPGRQIVHDRPALADVAQLPVRRLTRWEQAGRRERRHGSAEVDGERDVELDG